MSITDADFDSFRVALEQFLASRPDVDERVKIAAMNEALADRVGFLYMPDTDLIDSVCHALSEDAWLRAYLQSGERHGNCIVLFSVTDVDGVLVPPYDIPRAQMKNPRQWDDEGFL